MMRENVRDGEETRDLPRVSEEEGRGASSDDGSKKAKDWSASGTEDPAFFIKPSDGK